MSQFTLSLGNRIDNVDALEGGSNVSSLVGYTSLLPSLLSDNAWPLDFNLSFEYTAYPLAVYPSVYNLLFNSPDGRTSLQIHSVAAAVPLLTYWLGASTSVITTAYGSSRTGAAHRRARGD